MQTRFAGHAKTLHATSSASSEVLERTLETGSNILQVTMRIKLGLKLKQKSERKIT